MAFGFSGSAFFFELLFFRFTAFHLSDDGFLIHEVSFFFGLLTEFFGGEHLGGQIFVIAFFEGFDLIWGPSEIFLF